MKYLQFYIQVMKTDKLSIINHKIKVEYDSDFPYYVRVNQVNKDNNNLCIFIIRENKYSDSKNIME